jgi:FkbM family methyltransferase
MFMHPNQESLSVLKEFLQNPSRRYLFGATPYAAGVISMLKVNAIIDDFCSHQHMSNVPIIRTEDAPKDALVVSTILGRPLTARLRMANAGLAHCDFFSFYQYSGLSQPYTRFWTGFTDDALNHQNELEWAKSILADNVSEEVFGRIVAFRRSANLKFIEGFTDRQDQQYFEPFLNLLPSGESFADVGCFDGKTTIDFIKHCPSYDRVHIFEPDPRNLEVIFERFKDNSRIHCHPIGLGAATSTVRFSSSGSTSTIAANGQFEIRIETLDSQDIQSLTFLKMDIEGAELSAIHGAKKTIKKFHPRLAISVYHNPGDLWRIPRAILDVRSDYSVYIRHYTEGVVETVMFFIPEK